MCIPFSSDRGTHRIFSFTRLRRLCLCLALGCLVLQAQALVLSASDGAQGPRALSSGVEIQRDRSGQWTIADVAAGGARHGGFAPLNGAVEEGFTRDTVWLRLSPSRTPDAPSRWMLRLRPPRISEAVLYSPDGRGGFTQVDIGDRQPFAQREIPDHNFVYPLQLSTEPAEYLLKLRSDGPALRADLELWQAASFAQHRTTDCAVVGLLVGAAILSVCMNLIFMVWLRDSLYGHYALYVIGVAAPTLNRQASWRSGC